MSLQILSLTAGFEYFKYRLEFCLLCRRCSLDRLPRNNGWLCTFARPSLRLLVHFLGHLRSLCVHSRRVLSRIRSRRVHFFLCRARSHRVHHRRVHFSRCVHFSAASILAASTFPPRPFTPRPLFRRVHSRFVHFSTASILAASTFGGGGGGLNLQRATFQAKSVV